MTVGKMLKGYILWQSPKPYWPFSDYLDPKHSHLMTMLEILLEPSQQNRPHDLVCKTLATRCGKQMQVKYLQQLQYLLKDDINVELAKMHTKDTMGLTVQTLSFTFSSSPGKSAEELLNKAADMVRERLANPQKLGTQSDMHDTAADRSNGASSFCVTPSIPEMIIPIKDHHVNPCGRPKAKVPSHNKAVANVVTRADDQSLRKLHTHMQGVYEGDELPFTSAQLGEVDAQEKHIKVLQEQKHASKEMQQVVQKLPDVFDHVMCALETGSASGAVPVPIDTVLDKLSQDDKSREEIRLQLYLLASRVCRALKVTYQGADGHYVCKNKGTGSCNKLRQKLQNITDGLLQVPGDLDFAIRLAKKVIRAAPRTGVDTSRHSLAGNADAVACSSKLARAGSCAIPAQQATGGKTAGQSKQEPTVCKLQGAQIGHVQRQAAAKKVAEQATLKALEKINANLKGAVQQSAQPSGLQKAAASSATPVLPTEPQATSQAVPTSIASTQLPHQSAAATLDASSSLTASAPSAHLVAPKGQDNLDAAHHSQHHKLSPVGADTPSPAEAGNLLAATTEAASAAAPVPCRLAGASSPIAGLILPDAEPHAPVTGENNDSAAVFDNAHSKAAQQIGLKPAQNLADSLKSPVTIGTSLAGAVPQKTKMGKQNRAIQAAQFYGKKVWTPEMAAGGGTAATSVPDAISGASSQQKKLPTEKAKAQAAPQQQPQDTHPAMQVQQLQQTEGMPLEEAKQAAAPAAQESSKKVKHKKRSAEEHEASAKVKKTQKKEQKQSSKAEQDAIADGFAVLIVTAASAAFAGIPGIETILSDQRHKAEQAQQEQMQPAQLEQADLPEDEQMLNTRQLAQHSEPEAERKRRRKKKRKGSVKGIHVAGPTSALKQAEDSISNQALTQPADPLQEMSAGTAGSAEAKQVVNQPAQSSGDAPAGHHAAASPPSELPTDVARDRTGANEELAAAHAQPADSLQAMHCLSQDSPVSPAQLGKHDVEDTGSHPPAALDASQGGSLLDCEGSGSATAAKKKRTKRKRSAEEKGSAGVDKAKKQQTAEEKVMRKQGKKKRKADAQPGSDEAASLAEQNGSAAQRHQGAEEQDAGETLKETPASQDQVMWQQEAAQEMESDAQVADQSSQSQPDVPESGSAGAVAAQTSDSSVQPKRDGLSISSDEALAVAALWAQVHNLHQQLGTTQLDRQRNAVTECGQQAMQELREVFQKLARLDPATIPQEQQKPVASTASTFGMPQRRDQQPAQAALVSTSPAPTSSNAKLDLQSPDRSAHVPQPRMASSQHTAAKVLPEQQQNMGNRQQGLDLGVEQAASDSEPAAQQQDNVGVQAAAPANTNSQAEEPDVTEGSKDIPQVPDRTAPDSPGQRPQPAAASTNMIDLCEVDVDPQPSPPDGAKFSGAAKAPGGADLKQKAAARQKVQLADTDQKGRMMMTVKRNHWGHDLDECRRALARISSGWVDDFGVSLLMQAVCHTALHTRHKPAWFITPWHTVGYGSGSAFSSKERMFKQWTGKVTQKWMMPHALHQELIFVPCGLGQSPENESGSHWGLAVFTRIQAQQEGSPAIWRCDAYNSLPTCGDRQLHGKATLAMRGFEDFGAGAMRFNTAEPCTVTCPEQLNHLDCGMCVAGFALSLALGLDTDEAPTEYPSHLRKKWHDCIADGVHNKQFALLDESMLKA